MKIVAFWCHYSFQNITFVSCVTIYKTNIQKCTNYLNYRKCIWMIGLFQEFQNYLDIFGADAAQRLFRLYIVLVQVKTNLMKYFFNYTKKIKNWTNEKQYFFRRHVKKLKDSYLSERVARYLSLLPEVTNASSSSSLLSS